MIDESFPISGSSIRQSFGDANQAIFQSYNNEETGAGFPHGAYLSISNSHRFGEAIAQLADPLGVAAKGLTGTLSKYEKLNGKHTIFLFEQATDVLPAYAKYLLSCFTDEELNAGENCFAVGMVHTKNSPNASDKNYPIIFQPMMQIQPEYLLNPSSGAIFSVPAWTSSIRQTTIFLWLKVLPMV